MKTTLMRKVEILNNLKNEYDNCTKCAIGKTATQKVFGRGEVKADVLIIGEGPGRDEDRRGIPFVGISGQILDQVLLDCGFPPVYITNLVACRPINEEGSNRKPTDAECNNCFFRLKQIVETMNPKAIILLGRTAEQYFLGFKCFERFRIFCIEHPAYIEKKGGVRGPKYGAFVAKFMEVKNAIQSI